MVKTGKNIRYVDVSLLYPQMWKYGKFLIGLPKVQVGNVCKDVDLDLATV